MLPDMLQLNWTNVVEKSQNGSFGEIFDNIVACGQKSVTRQVTIKLDKSWWKMSTCLIWWFFDKIVACSQTVLPDRPKNFWHKLMKNANRLLWQFFSYIAVCGQTALPDVACV